MAEWMRVKESGANIITWWQHMVKGGITFLANARSKELKKESMGQLNMLKLKQSYLTSKLSLNTQAIITELTMINMQISQW